MEFRKCTGRSAKHPVSQGSARRVVVCRRTLPKFAANLKRDLLRTTTCVGRSSVRWKISPSPNERQLIWDTCSGHVIGILDTTPFESTGRIVKGVASLEAHPYIVNQSNLIPRQWCLDFLCSRMSQVMLSCRMNVGLLPCQFSCRWARRRNAE